MMIWSIPTSMGLPQQPLPSCHHWLPPYLHHPHEEENKSGSLLLPNTTTATTMATFTLPWRLPILPTPTMTSNRPFGCLRLCHLCAIPILPRPLLQRTTMTKKSLTIRSVWIMDYIIQDEGEKQQGETMSPFASVAVMIVTSPAFATASAGNHSKIPTHIFLINNSTTKR